MSPFSKHCYTATILSVQALAAVTYNWLSPNMKGYKSLTDVLYVLLDNLKIL
jgi:hypothetical protein